MKYAEKIQFNLKLAEKKKVKTLEGMEVGKTDKCFKEVAGSTDQKSDQVNRNSEGNVDPRKQMKAITLGTMVHSPIIVSCPCGIINNQ